MTSLPSYSNPEGVGAPLSLYSNVAKSGDFVFAAGQIGVDERNEPVGPDVVSQSVQAYENVRVLLESQGATLRHVVRFVVYIVDADDVAGFWSAREQYFAEHYPDGEYPPNTLLIVQGLVRPDLRVEIDATAHVT